MRRENITLKNQRKRNLEILKVHFDKFKEFHERKQQIKKFVNAWMIDPYSEPRQPTKYLSELNYDYKSSINMDQVKDHKFTNAVNMFVTEKLERVLKSDVDNQEDLASSYDSIHFRITLFLTKPDEESRTSSVFCNWLIKNLTNNKKTLNGLNRKFIGKKDDEKLILFCKNLSILNDANLWYTLNAHYEYKPEERLRSKGAEVFYQDYVTGSNMIVYVVNSKISFENLVKMCESIQKYTMKSLVVYNIAKISKVKNQEINKL